VPPSRRRVASLRRLALLVEYEGTAYGGSQYQKNARTIQAELESAVGSLTGESIRVALAGRTDAGVHARGQVASFLTVNRYPPSTFIEALNSYLPEDIAVRAAAEVPLSFNVRRLALSRRYRYTIHNSGQRSALWPRFLWHINVPLGLSAMKEAARCLLGEHDFAAFTRPSVKARQSTVRVVQRAEVCHRGNWVFFIMEASAFLPQQVRRTVGLLAQVGGGKLSVEGFCDLVRSAHPGAANVAAPPQGLCLLKVNYEIDPFGHKGDEDEDLFP